MIRAVNLALLSILLSLCGQYQWLGNVKFCIFQNSTALTVLCTKYNVDVNALSLVLVYCIVFCKVTGLESRFTARTLAATTSATQGSPSPGSGNPGQLSVTQLIVASCECGRSKTFFVLSSLSLSLLATSPALLFFLFSLLSLAPSVYDVYYVFLILPSSWVVCVLSLLFGCWLSL